MTALAKKPENRFADARAMREAIEAAMVVPVEKRSNARRYVSRTAAALVFGAVSMVGIHAIRQEAPSPGDLASVLTSAVTLTSEAVAISAAHPTVDVPVEPAPVESVAALESAAAASEPAAEESAVAEPAAPPPEPVAEAVEPPVELPAAPPVVASDDEARRAEPRARRRAHARAVAASTRPAPTPRSTRARSPR